MGIAVEKFVGGAELGLELLRAVGREHFADVVSKVTIEAEAGRHAVVTLTMVVRDDAGPRIGAKRYRLVEVEDAEDDDAA